MKDSKFVILFKTLKPEEEKPFYKYLKQLHGGTEALRLYEYLRKLHPKLEDDKKLSIEHAFQAIHRRGIHTHENNRRNMLNDLYELHKWLKEYLLTQRVHPDTWEGQLLWIDILSRRDLKKEFAKEVALFHEKAEQEPKKDAGDYFKAMAANYFRYNLLTEDKTAPRSVLQVPIDAVETYAETIRLQMACEVLNRMQIHPFVDKKDSKTYKKSKDTPAAIADQHLLTLYRAVFELLSTPPGHLADEQYDKLEALLHKSTKRIAPSEWVVIFKYLSNYAAIQIRRGREDIYGEKNHNLNQLGIKHNIFKENGYISAAQFNNIVTVACTAGKMSWAYAFIEQQGRFLDPSEKAEIILLAKAIVDFENGNYEKVKKALLPLDIKDLQERIRLKSLMLRTYYELNEDFGVVQNYYLAFERMLRRQTEPHALYVTAALSFVSIFKALLGQNTPKPILLKRIKEEPNLFSRPWLHHKALSYQAIKSQGRKKK